METPDSQTAELVPVPLQRLFQRLQLADRQMAPHQRCREQGQLIMDSCETVGAVVSALHVLAEHLGRGARLKMQDGEYWLFSEDGEGIQGGTIFDAVLGSPLNVKGIAVGRDGSPPAGKTL